MELPVSNGRIPSRKHYSSESRARNKAQGGATIQFEVAPDPNSQALAARWRRLPDRLKREITQRVAQHVVPQALAALRVKGELIEQTGGYLGETNPSLAVRLVRGHRGIEVAKFLGHVFAQQSVMVVSESRRKGLEGVDVIAIRLPQNYSVRQISDLYERLWSLRLNGQRPITGHTTVAGEMSIMNFSGIETKTLRTSIDEFLRGAFATQIKRIYAASVDKPGCSHANGRQVWPVASGQLSALGWHDYLRWKVVTTLRSALAQDEKNERSQTGVTELVAA